MSEETMGNQTQEGIETEINTEVTTPEDSGNQTTEGGEATVGKEGTESAPQGEATNPDAPKIKIKYNHEEKEITLDEATMLAQKGMNYDKVYESLQARDAEVARRFGDRGITTWEQLVSGWDMAQKQQQQQIVDQTYLQSIKKIADSYGADPELLSKIVNEAVRFHPLAAKANQLEQQFGEIQTEKQMKEKMDRDIAEFRSVYPEVDAKTIPDVVWEKVNNGMPLIDAYRIHENTAIKQELAELKKALQVQKTNEANSATSPGSVKGTGETVDDFISFNTFEKNKTNQSWVTKNYNRIMESRQKW